MIKVLNFKKMQKNTLQGFVDISFPETGMEIYGCTFHKKGQQEWIGLPQKEYTDGEGQKKYVSIVRYNDRGLSDAFSRDVIQAINSFELDEARNHVKEDFGGDDLPF